MSPSNSHRPHPIGAPSRAEYGLHRPPRRTSARSALPLAVILRGPRLVPDPVFEDELGVAERLDPDRHGEGRIPALLPDLELLADHLVLDVVPLPVPVVD